MQMLLTLKCSSSNSWHLQRCSFKIHGTYNDAGENPPQTRFILRLLHDIVIFVFSESHNTRTHHSLKGPICCSCVQ